MKVLYCRILSSHRKESEKLSDVSLRRPSILSSEHRVVSNLDDGLEPVVGEELTCRICGEGGTPDDPLFHPCRCTGSIRYIHEPCLLKWLATKSGGRTIETHNYLSALFPNPTCELCGSQFEFSAEYSQEYSGKSSFILSLWLVFDILNSLVRQSWQRLLSPVRWIGWIFFVPSLVGVTGLWLLSLIARTEGMVYDHHVTDLRNGAIFRVRSPRFRPSTFPPTTLPTRHRPPRSLTLTRRPR